MNQRTSTPARILRTARGLLSQLWHGIVKVIADLYFFSENWLLDTKHAQYGLAVTRIIIGFVGIGLLLTNFNARLYTFGEGSAWNGELAEPVSDFPNIWLFSLFHNVADNPALFTLLYILLGILAVIIMLGWRTRIMLPIYLIGWVSFIEVNDSAGDQGDNAYRIFLIALLFADTSMRLSLDARRRARPIEVAKPWWQRKLAGERLLPAELTNLAHNIVLIVLTFQVSAIYVSGALYKAGGTPWSEGWAVYDPLHVAQFSTWPGLADLLTVWGPGVAAISWGSIILQMAFPFMLLRRGTRVVALLGILSFHIGIGVLMGLPWFSLTMIAVDAIFIRDESWKKLGTAFTRTWASTSSTSSTRTGE
ncbi:Vitamin K-dependent gamma-carboxylase [Brevibacterium sp. Mu109]|uniref:HTTM domain-containing protein n=1 Tax=Brevibacterium sp. Mu109 TaxID=1255669 RepID=UPI000C361739|nr:HTTM domain-containing protein [Brevibacterium sp. Mu109]SMX95741.1 Vitamin K-dependent gamma-carboxylase [Brevibacterium sp. Mu109]